MTVEERLKMIFGDKMPHYFHRVNRHLKEMQAEIDNLKSINAKLAKDFQLARGIMPIKEQVS